MGQLFQAGRHETAAHGNGHMDTAENPGNLLETVEKGANKVPHDTLVYAIPEWNVHTLANCRKGPWRVAFMLNSILTNKEIARQGYITMTSYYKQSL
jgi:hypothetical protein